MENYEIIVDNATRKFTVKFKGFFTLEGAKGYEMEYSKKVKGAAGYKLILDARDLKTFASDIISVLKSCYMRYMKDFKDIELWLPTDDVVGKMQLQRVAREVGFKPIFK